MRETLCSRLSLALKGKDERELREESAEERLRRRAYERGCLRLKKRIEGKQWPSAHLSLEDHLLRFAQSRLNASPSAWPSGGRPPDPDSEADAEQQGQGDGTCPSEEAVPTQPRRSGHPEWRMHGHSDTR